MFRPAADLFKGDDAGAAQTARLGGEPSFGATLESAFNNVNTLQNKASEAATSFALGKINDVHSVMVASQKATVALELTAQVRNKIIDAYTEAMHMSM